MIAGGDIDILRPDTVAESARRAVEDYVEPIPGAKKKLEQILQVMIYGHFATQFRQTADQMLTALY